MDAAVPTDCPGPANFLLCDGFESGSMLGSVWHASTDAQQTLTVETTKPFRGSWSLHAHVDQLSTGVYISSSIKETSTFAVDQGLYYRAYYWLANVPGVSNVYLMNAGSSAAGQSASGGMGISGDAFNDGIQNTGTSNDYSTQSPQMMQTGAWVCIETEINTLSPALGLMQVWSCPMNGTTCQGGGEATPVSGLTGTADIDQVVSMEFGLGYTGPTPAVDLYIDEIVVSTSFVSCNQ
jgi:hypothetical protein